ncbi:hypothetical protein HSB1_46770 [Halogranum salarium B-1]|uniref:Uncharacterized protein n=1 Tax=Halogranum salarium B-1 TaxID=1210908 RepID=J2Z8C6_9EURY|nr:hypothetical protein HSB1_46770 [Halogranum salarium B-1]
MVFESLSNLGERAVRGVLIDPLLMILVSSGLLEDMLSDFGYCEPLFRPL